MEPQWQPPHDPGQPYPSPPPGAPAYRQPVYGPAAYGPPGYGWAPPPQGAPWGQPTGPHVVWAVLLWALAGLSLIGALIFGTIAAAGFWSDSQMKTYGVTTTATVTDVNRFMDTYTVEFTTEDGEVATAEIMWPSATPAIGDQVEITYDAQDPSYAVEAGSPEDMIVAAVYSLAAFLALAVMVGSVIGAVLVHRRRGKAQRQRATW